MIVTDEDLRVESINQALIPALGILSDSDSIFLGPRIYHQKMAMRAAIQVSQSYSSIAKQKARRDCVGHLRASLAEPVYASSGPTTEQVIAV